MQAQLQPSMYYCLGGQDFTCLLKTKYNADKANTKCPKIKPRQLFICSTSIYVDCKITIKFSKHFLKKNA